MKQSSFNFLCLFVALISGVMMFLLKYHVLEQEKELALLRRQIISDQRELHLLKADWAVLTDPQNLINLIKEMGLKSVLANQIVHPDDVEDREPSIPENSVKESSNV